MCRPCTALRARPVAVPESNLECVSVHCVTTTLHSCWQPHVTLAPSTRACTQKLQPGPMKDRTTASACHPPSRALVTLGPHTLLHHSNAINIRSRRHTWAIKFRILIHVQDDTLRGAPHATKPWDDPAHATPNGKRLPHVKNPPVLQTILLELRNMYPPIALPAPCSSLHSVDISHAGSSA